MENIVMVIVLAIGVITFTLAFANKWLPKQFCSIKGWHVNPLPEPGNPRPTRGICPRCGKMMVRDHANKWVSEEEYGGLFSKQYGNMEMRNSKTRLALQSDSSMTIYEAERIVEIYSIAIESSVNRNKNDRKEGRTTPIERIGVHAPFLRGFNIFQITTAINLRIANEFLYCKEKETPMEEMDRTVENYLGALILLLTAKTGNEPREQIDPSKFYSYCKEIGSDDLMFWQKIYTKLGLEYTRVSPQKNRIELIDYSNGFER